MLEKPGSSVEEAQPQLEMPVRTDESGDVDISLIEHMLSLTPTERLARLEEFATIILEARKIRESDASLPSITTSPAPEKNA